MLTAFHLLFLTSSVPLSYQKVFRRVLQFSTSQYIFFTVCSISFQLSSHRDSQPSPTAEARQHRGSAGRDGRRHATWSGTRPPLGEGAHVLPGHGQLPCAGNFTKREHSFHSSYIYRILLLFHF